MPYPALPHFLQNRAPGLTGALHPGHKSSSFDPHCSQRQLLPRRPHCMLNRASLYALSSSSRVLASFKSAVSKPSVNHP